MTPPKHEAYVTAEVLGDRHVAAHMPFRQNCSRGQSTPLVNAFSNEGFVAECASVPIGGNRAILSKNYIPFRPERRHICSALHFDKSAER